jgi:hypothetical protein
LTPRLLGEHPGFCQDRRLDTFGFQTGDEQTVVRLAGALVKQDGFAMICSFRGPVCHEMYWEIWLSPALTCPPQTFPGTFPPQRNKSKEQASEKAVASRLSLHSTPRRRRGRRPDHRRIESREMERQDQGGWEAPEPLRIPEVPAGIAREVLGRW